MDVNAIPYPQPVPVLDGLRPGQRWRSRLGTTYDIYAVLSSGYVLCTKRQDRKVVRVALWCDLFLNWTEVK